MAVATKAAAFAVFVRFFDVALGPQADDWQPALAVPAAAISIVVGNVGALGQDSLKRMLGYSGVAQAGYMLGGLVVATEAGVNALVFYLAAYAFMNLAAFAVIVARERETPTATTSARSQGLGRERPLLAWPLTISMLGLAGLPATAGFIGKLYLIEALVEGDYTWLAVFIAVGTMISLAYYLRVVAAMWMPARNGPSPAATPAIAGASPEADPIDPDAGRRPYLVAPALLAAAGGRLLRGHPPAAGRVRRARRRLALLPAGPPPPWARGDKECICVWGPPVFSAPRAPPPPPPPATPPPRGGGSRATARR